MGLGRGKTHNPQGGWSRVGAAVVQHTNLVGTTVYLPVQRGQEVRWTWAPHTVVGVYVTESRLWLAVSDDETGEFRDAPLTYARATPPKE